MKHSSPLLIYRYNFLNILATLLPILDFSHLTISNITLTRCYGNAGNHFLRFRRASASFLNFSIRLADSSVIVTLPSKTHPGRAIIQSVFNFLHLSVSKS